MLHFIKLYSNPTFEDIKEALLNLDDVSLEELEELRSITKKNHRKALDKHFNSFNIGDIVKVNHSGFQFKVTNILCYEKFLGGDGNYYSVTDCKLVSRGNG